MLQMNYIEFIRLRKFTKVTFICLLHFPIDLLYQMHTIIYLYLYAYIYTKHQCDYNTLTPKKKQKQKQ